MKAIIALIASAALCLGPILASPALATPASASATPFHFIKGCRAQGDYAICTASGSVNHPHSITVHVIARPGQHVSGAWSVVCTKGTGAGSKSGNFSGWASARSNLTHKLKMPYRRPDSCTVAADAQLAHSGHIHLWLTAVV